MKKLAKIFSSDRNNLQLLLSRVEYTAGNRIEGQIQLNLSSPTSYQDITISICGHVNIEFDREEKITSQSSHVGHSHGKEIGHSHSHSHSHENEVGHSHSHSHSHSNSSTRKEWKTEYVNHEFYKSQSIVYRFPPTPLAAGSHCFPFAIDLPCDLPSTFNERQNGSKFSSFQTSRPYHCMINYSLEACCHSSYPGMGITVSHPMTIHELVVESPVVSTANTQKSYVMSKGSLKFNATLDRYVVHPGMLGLCKAVINSSSVKSIGRLEVCVNRTLELKSNWHEFSKTTQVFKKTYAGVTPCFYGIRYLAFQLPPDINESLTRSRYASLKYSVTITCVGSGMFSDLVIVLPLVVAMPQSYVTTGQAPPASSLESIPQDVSYRPEWMPDKASKKCTNCQSSFTLFKRRHHCRNCLRLVCHKCSPRSIKLHEAGYFDEKVRTCVPCENSVNQRRNNGQTVAHQSSTHTQVNSK